MPTARVKPSGKPLCSGFRTLVTFELDPDIQLWEKSVTPPGMDGGDKIDQSTYHNEFWRTYCPRALVEMTDLTYVAAYTPEVYGQLVAMMNIPQLITTWFSNGYFLDLPGWLRVSEPSESTEDAQPEMTITISFSMEDTDEGTEYTNELSTVSGSTTTTTAAGAPINPLTDDDNPDYQEYNEEDRRHDHHREDHESEPNENPDADSSDNPEHPQHRRSKRGRRPSNVRTIEVEELVNA